MYTAERQREHLYLAQMKGPVFEQWYLLHHRMVRVVTNHEELARQVRSYFYYAELLAEYTYEDQMQLPVEIPIDLLWQAGERMYKPVALTCYLFETVPGQSLPPVPELVPPEGMQWEDITGVEGPLRLRWKTGSLRLREYQAYEGVSSRVFSMREKYDLHATIYIEDVARCTPWFLMRFVFYMEVGAMLSTDGYEVVHAGAMALDERTGTLLVGSPGSGKTTLILSCLHAGGMLHLADDVLFIAKDDGLVRMYAFPEDIGVRKGTLQLLGQYEFMQTLAKDEREKRFVNIQQYFRSQVIQECPVRILLFVHEEQRAADFRAERITPAQAVSILMQEYISHNRAKEGDVSGLFEIFTTMAEQGPSYALWLTPDPLENATQVRVLLEQHRA